MTRTHPYTIVTLLATASLATGAAHATPQTFFGENLDPDGNVEGDPVDARDDFLANLEGVGTEDFEGFDLGEEAPLSLSFPGSIDPITATLSGGDAEIDDGGAGRFPTSGDQFLETEGGSDFEITFSDPISAFGFFGTDIGDFGGELILEFSNGTTEEVNVGNTVDAPNASLLYFGLVDRDNSYESIAFENTDGSDYFGFDDMTIGDIGQVREEPVSDVPLGGTATLFGGGLLAMLAAGVRRRMATV